MRDCLFERPVDLDDPVILRNLSEPEASKVLFDCFHTAINALTIRDSGASRIEGHIRLRDTRPFRTEPRALPRPLKNPVFNKIVGEASADSLELAFAAFLEGASDVQSLRQELHGRGIQARLREGEWRAFDLYAGFFRRARRTALCGSLRPRAARNWTFRKKWRGSNNGATTRARRPKPRAGRAMASSMSTKRVSKSISPRLSRH